MITADKQMSRVEEADSHPSSSHLQSYSIEMLEVTGGKFWKPYTENTTTAQPESAEKSVPAGMEPSMPTANHPQSRP
ncbi:hypothetical protein [Pseudomonas sp. R5(2019)]|uniref:hypothetical protein n=1 Tax=Pseudomonas sp. R5(2019) TaxID=2697566 RepID=UPI001411F2B1|nr:hypothetical protein [Pseudomonas sp. R5(2019)]NBA95468.1 hypothetical protein [Pseudomonas sp. R5(2019)]